MTFLWTTQILNCAKIAFLKLSFLAYVAFKNFVINPGDQVCSQHS